MSPGTLDLGLPWRLSGEESSCNAGGRLRCRRHKFDPWVRKTPERRKWQPTPVFLPGKSYGQRSLAGYSPWHHRRLGHKSCTHSETRRWEVFTPMPPCVLFYSLLGLLRLQTRLPALAIFGYQPSVISLTVPSLDSMR